ncbi:hypothetical protein GJ496_009375 [Pomphorhynchus laevis]|nr:hypothetical protein GJ496_009375 [Pomphorhynchus laevis]
MTGPLSVVEVSLCSYWHMCSTRQLKTSDWVQERRNRQTVTNLRHVLGENAIVNKICRIMRITMRANNEGLNNDSAAFEHYAVQSILREYQNTKILVVEMRSPG